MLIVYGCCAFCTTAQNSDLEGLLNNGWILVNSFGATVLSTANGNKTISTMMTEAMNAIAAISIPENYAYEINSITVPTGNNTSGFIVFNVYNLGLMTNFSNINIRGSRVIQSSDNMQICALDLSSKLLAVVNVAYATGNVNAITDYLNRKPASGTQLSLGYRVWRKPIV